MSSFSWQHRIRFSLFISYYYYYFFLNRGSLFFCSIYNLMKHAISPVLLYTLYTLIEVLILESKIRRRT